MINNRAITPAGGWSETLWDYTRPEILNLCRLLIEVALLTPLALLLMPWAALWSPQLLALWLLLLMLIPAYLNRVLLLLRVPATRRRLLLLVAGLLAMLLNLRLILYHPPSLFSLAWLNEFYAHLSETGNPYGQRDFVIVFLTVAAWWRGLALVGRRNDIQDTNRRFYLAVGILWPLVLLLTANRLRFDVTQFVLLFLLASLMTAALTRAQQIEAGESEAAFPFSLGWLGRVFGASAGIVLLTGILAGILSGEQVDTLLGWLGPVWRAAQLTVTVIITFLLYLGQPIFAVLQWLADLVARLFAGSGTVAVTPPATPAGVGTATPTPTPVFVPADNALLDLLAWLVGHAQLLGIVAVALFLLLAVFISYRSQRQLAATRRPEQMAREVTPAGRSPAIPGRGLLDRARRWRQLWNAANIRRIYENMSYLAAVNGYPRAAVETPYEYRQALRQAWPERQGEIEQITQAYIQVRYGEIPESRAELEALKEAWERLRKTPPMRRTGEGLGTRPGDEDIRS